MDDIKGIRTLVLNQDNPQELREQVRHYFHQTFSIDERLYDLVARDEGFYLRADPLRHPLVFYLGHTAVFYINKLNIARIVSRRINPELESIFAVGVDEMSWDDLNEEHYNWPSIPAVRAYRDQVRAFVDELISSLPLDEKGITWDSPWWAIMMGIEHQRIHLETSSVLIRQLPINEVRALDFWPVCPNPGDAPVNALLEQHGGVVELGKDFDNPLYGWDNEYGHKSFSIGPFKASRYLVSNGEFREFVEAGGYQTREYWTDEGWDWKNYQQAEFPRFWHKDESGAWKLRTIASIIPLPWNHPVEVNYLEAKAFCNWKAKLENKPIRLPTEAEWYLMRNRHLKTDQPWWQEAPGNINLEHWASTCPVDTFCFGEFYDLIGNVWQWTETPISAFPGFKVHPYYDDFSVPTFDTRHNMIKGGSFISTGNEAIKDSRYAFRRHFYQHAGFRYVESADPLPVEHNLYEDDPEIIPWCDLNWGRGVLDKPYHQSLMELLAPLLLQVNHGSALNMGCKTGRSAFELARHFDRVLGLDSTARLIRLATQMKEEGFIRYIRPEEGEIISTTEIRLAELGLAECAPRVEFWQADSANLAPKYSGYDLILAENVLERSSNPRQFLAGIHERLHPGGMLIIADGYAWDESFTRTENRLGGFRKDGEPFSSFEGVQEILTRHFDQMGNPRDILQALRTQSRIWELKVLQVSVWKLKDI